MLLFLALMVSAKFMFLVKSTKLYSNCCWLPNLNHFINFLHISLLKMTFRGKAAGKCELKIWMSICVDILLNPVQELFSSVNLFTVLLLHVKCNDHSSNSILYHCRITPFLPGGCSCPTRPCTASCHLKWPSAMQCSIFDWERSMADHSQDTGDGSCWHQDRVTPTLLAIHSGSCVLECSIAYFCRGGTQFSESKHLLAFYSIHPLTRICLV